MGGKLDVLTASENFSDIEGVMRGESPMFSMGLIIEELFDVLGDEYNVVLLQIKIFDIIDGSSIFAKRGDKSFEDKLEDPDNWSGDGVIYYNLYPQSPADVMASLGEELRAGFYQCFPNADPRWWMVWQWVTESSSQVEMMGWDMPIPVGRDTEF